MIFERYRGRHRVEDRSQPLSGPISDRLRGRIDDAPEVERVTATSDAPHDGYQVGSRWFTPRKDD